MTKSAILICFFSLTVTSCAQPKYYVPQVNTQTTREMEKATCPHRFPQNQLCLNWYWETEPTLQQKGTMIFKTFRLNLYDQTPVEADTPTTPQLVLWMPSMGHGSTPTQVTRLDVGTYKAQNVFFIMPGEWEFRFEIKNNNEMLDAITIPISF